jgi:hypothetical protein
VALVHSIVTFTSDGTFSGVAKNAVYDRKSEEESVLGSTLTAFTDQPVPPTFTVKVEPAVQTPPDLFTHTLRKYTFRFAMTGVWVRRMVDTPEDLSSRLLEKACKAAVVENTLVPAVPAATVQPSGTFVTVYVDSSPLVRMEALTADRKLGPGPLPGSFTPSTDWVLNRPTISNCSDPLLTTDWTHETLTASGMRP